MPKPDELPIIQRMYDLILWYVPRLNKLPRDYKFALGDRIQTQLYAVRVLSSRLKNVLYWKWQRLDERALMFT